jgi:alkanesulfonate monooxygenase SsuD/methylene tetrahydromethanopterin reductase-like flavin-dependent oxidoreductase (luciferase family)
VTFTVTVAPRAKPRVKALHSSFLVEHHFTGWNQVSATRFSHHGRFWRFEDIVVEPPPAQRPHPPFWMAAGSPPSIRKAAERGFNLMLDQVRVPGADRRAYDALPRRA